MTSEHGESMENLTKAQLCALYMLQGKTSTVAARLAGYEWGIAHADAIRIHSDAKTMQGQEYSWVRDSVEDKRRQLAALLRILRAVEVLEALETEWARFLEKSLEEE